MTTDGDYIDGKYITINRDAYIDGKYYEGLDNRPPPARVFLPAPHAHLWESVFGKPGYVHCILFELLADGKPCRMELPAGEHHGARNRSVVLGHLALIKERAERAQRCDHCESAFTVQCDTCLRFLCEPCYLRHLDRGLRCADREAVPA